MRIVNELTRVSKRRFFKFEFLSRFLAVKSFNNIEQDKRLVEVSRIEPFFVCSSFFSLDRFLASLY